MEIMLRIIEQMVERERFKFEVLLTVRWVLSSGHPESNRRASLRGFLNQDSLLLRHQRFHLRRRSAFLGLYEFSLFFFVALWIKA